MKVFQSLSQLLPSFFGLMGFEKAWEASVRDYFAGRITDPVAGPWTGTWQTDTNGNRGQLRCLVSPSDEQAGRYRFHYHATWYRIFRGGCRVQFDVTENPDGSRTVEGSKDLGFFSAFKHVGKISGKRFEATYSNRRGEIGGFEMTRPE